MTLTMTSLLSDIADLVLGRRCIGCDAQPRLLCDTCQSQMLGQARVVREFTMPAIAQDLRLPLAVAHTYAPPVSTVIFKYKDNQIPALAPFLAKLAAHALDQIASYTGTKKSGVTAVPIPTRSMSIRIRGFDPMELISRNAKSFGYHFLPALTDNRRTGRSKSLTVAQRIESANEAFSLRSDSVVTHLSGRQVIVIDDVTTTGTTLRSAAEVLMQAGVQVIGCASIAGSRK